VAEEFFLIMQQRQLFDKVQVSTSGCLGPCSEGPTVLVYPEGVMYGNVTRNDVAEIFDEHLDKGRPVSRLLMSEEFW
jgi:(2Fe-2S) ferredoxin